MPRLFSLTLLVSLALAGCVSTQPVYYAEGVTLSTRAADLAQCQASAHQQFPVQMVTRFTPRVYVPPRQVCNSAGACHIRPGYFDGGDPYQVDLNRAGRAQAQQSCMATRGYARISLPSCEAGTAVRPSATMPPLQNGTCIMPGGGDAAPIANPL